MKTVLIVDDDEILQLALSRRLEAQGFTVMQATSGQEALDMLTTQPADAVVSDILMPGMDGFEFCRQLRSSPIGQIVPFIFLSSLAEVRDRVQGHLIGADDYLVKPFHAQELIAKVKGGIARSERVNDTLEHRLQQAKTITAPPLPDCLSTAEAKVFWQVIQGWTNKEIAQHLFLSPRTVQTHLSNILAKLKLKNRSQLVRYAFEQGYKSTEESPGA
ncbi:MAG: response regulator transcription factor [Cyanobacteria bacterium REEB459]|nr:response regulator transcription factor [Cyanobacteria bacterium REEB459]